MLVALVKAVLMSSTAFFIEAAAKTVMLGSWAAAGCGAAATVAIVRATARDLKDVNIVALHWGGGRNRARIRAPASAGHGCRSDRSGSAVPGHRMRLRRSAGRRQYPSKARARS